MGRDVTPSERWFQGVWALVGAHLAATAATGLPPLLILLSLLSASNCCESCFFLPKVENYTLEVPFFKIFRLTVDMCQLCQLSILLKKNSTLLVIFGGMVAEIIKMYSDYWYLRVIKVSTMAAERWRAVAAVAEKSA